MKSSRYIQNTDLATLKNDGRTTATINIPQTAIPSHSLFSS